MLKFFQGEFISYDFRAGPATGGLIEHFKEQKYLETSYDVKTDETTYHIAIKEFIKDDFDPNNIGLYSLYIIDSKIWEYSYAYWGGGKWIPGINIEQEGDT